MLKAVIFDLDGTLLCTVADLCDSVNYALSSFGFPAITLEMATKMIGNGVRILITRAAPEGTDECTVNELLARFKSHYKDNMENKTKAYDGIVEMLSALKKKGIKTAVLSNKYDAATKRLCDDLLTGLIDLPVGERQGRPRKPDPDGVMYILDQLSCNASECALVGDADTDMKTALNAGVIPVGVSWGYRSVDALREGGAHIIADTSEQLYRILIEM